jgi:hypothetical protein
MEARRRDDYHVHPRSRYREAAAAEQEITLEQLRVMDTNKNYGRQIVMSLGASQVAKFKAENGERAWLEWREKLINEVAESPPDEVDSMCLVAPQQASAVAMASTRSSWSVSRQSLSNRRVHSESSS